MNITKAISQLDSLMPNVFNESLKRQWLSEVDAVIVMLRKHYMLSDEEQAVVDEWAEYTDTTPSETELLVGIPFTDIYLNYMAAKINYLQSDINRYNNAMALYQKTYESYANEFNRLHTPATTSIVAFPANGDEATEWVIP